MLLTVGCLALSLAGSAPRQEPRFEVSFTAAARPTQVTGRLIVIVAKRDQPEPRLAISPSGPAIFGIDLDQVPPGQTVVVDAAAVGYPNDLGALPAGDYVVQAMIIPYTKVTRSDGHTIWVPLNDGTIAPFNGAPGTLVSEPQPATIRAGSLIPISITRALPKPARPADTEWLKRVTIQSAKLSQFWGHPIFIHATVLLPRGYPDGSTYYPSLYTLGHSVPFQFTTDSVGRNLGQINPITGTETGFDFGKAWRSDGFPRLIAITLEQQTPFFPDSYSVNSMNNGPYGDAVVEEVIPELERRFRIIRQPYARQLEGASTSGWQSLALQLKYPDFFGGAWIFQPDPIDFRRYQLVDIYQDQNAFGQPLGPFGSIERPFRRTVEGQVVWTVRQVSRFEAVLGSKGRSQFQLGAWEAVYGPVGPDGYPKPLWDKLTGAIDRTVAESMRERGFDLRDYAERNWPALGPKLVGKLHFFLPDMDDFYLNLAMYRFDEFLKRTTNPHYPGEWHYGRPMKGHSWHPWTWADLVRRVAQSVEAAAPR
jgi:hypothetical protein